MPKVFICDDNDSIRNQIEELIKDQIMIHEYDLEIECSCKDPQLLLQKIEDRLDKRSIYFLDVDLKHPIYDGFQLGKKIRHKDPFGIIIYITSFGDLAYKTFQYHIEAFDYIVKSDIETLKQSISKCLDSINQKIYNDKKINRSILLVK